MTLDPRTAYPQPPFPKQTQTSPGDSARMNPAPDHGEATYKGSGRLAGKMTLVTGGDSGIGRAVALAFAREGADVAVAYLNEDQDARETERLVLDAGRRCILVPGDLSRPEAAKALIAAVVEAFGRIDVLVNNAAYQMTRDSILDIPDEEWDYTFRANVGSLFHVTKAAVPHMTAGAAIVNTSSVNSKNPMPGLLAYSATKAAIANITVGLAQGLADKGIRVNAVLPGPIWTPFIPTGMKSEQIASFGSKVPLKRPGQPAELAPAYVLLASDEASYMSGALVTVAGGMPIF